MKAVALPGLALILCGLASSTLAQTIVVPGSLRRDDPQLPHVMADIAVQTLRLDASFTPEQRLPLELAAGRYDAARGTLAEIRRGRRADDPDLLLDLRWEIYVRGRDVQNKDGKDSVRAFREAVADVLRDVDGLASYKLFYSLGTPLTVIDSRLDDAFTSITGRSDLDVASAVAIEGAWITYAVYHAIRAELPAIMADDDRRRYDVKLDVPVRTPDGAIICAYVMRPKRAERLPTLLNFTIYADQDKALDNARITAAHGYAAVEGFTRGKACGPDAPVPMEHDGADADTLIDWIAAQPWSDGRVGMYGGSYEGFTQWAAAKHPPKALKALMPSVSFSPGTDFPMEGNISLTEAYTWPLYTTSNKMLDDATYGDTFRWERLRRDWYLSGRPYRDLDRIDGIHNPFFQAWLEHPGFDAYWRGLIPSDQELRRLDIPVLTTTGYYDSGQIGALSYLARRERLNPKAEQYLVIGPYDHRTGQLGTISPLGSSRPTLRGYSLDPIAQLDIIGLRYAWFDYILRGAPKPAILVDHVNYQVMGANVWKHASSIDAMERQTSRYYFGPGRVDDMHILTRKPEADGGYAELNVDLADRRDVDQFAPAGPLIDQTGDDWPIITRVPSLPNALVFMSDPFVSPPEISGLFSGQLHFVANKKDFDLAVTLFERTADGEDIQLSYTWQRMSYARDRTHRQLIVPGKRTTITFRAGRLTSRQFQPGSRLVVVLNIIKQPSQQINYGTGKSVSDETIKDAGTPLKIMWFRDSFVDIPNGSGQGESGEAML